MYLSTQSLQLLYHSHMHDCKNWRKLVKNNSNKNGLKRKGEDRS